MELAQAHDELRAAREETESKVATAIAQAKTEAEKVEAIKATKEQAETDLDSTISQAMADAVAAFREKKLP